MDSTHLSLRLQAVANYVKKGARIADIGSDHAYLPAYLARHQQIDYAIAGEVARGPFDNAKHEIQSQGLADIVHPRLANGLKAIMPDDKIDTVIIAGMGGILITEILSARLTQHQRFPNLILQPNTDEFIVREWLMKHDYTIHSESIVQEGKHFYEVMMIGQGRQTLSRQDIYFGPVLSKQKSPTFKARWEKELERIRIILLKLRQANKMNTQAYDEWSQRYQEIQEVLNR